MLVCVCLCMNVSEGNSPVLISNNPLVSVMLIAQLEKNLRTG